MLKKRCLRVLTLALALLLLCAPLAACTINRDPLAVTAFASLSIDKKQRVNATVTLTLPEAEAREGERAYIYELLPGESIADVSEKAPLDNARVSTEMKFRFPLKDGERTRLYSSFAVCFSDGTPILSTPRTIDNPEILAGSVTLPLWSKNPKGLTVSSDADTAASLGTTQALVSVDLSMLAADGDVSFAFCGNDYRVSSFILEILDLQVRSSYQAGMQVTLSVDAGHAALTPELRTALLDFLAERYSHTENGIISAFFIETDGLTLTETVELTSVAHKALLCRVSSGRVYVVCPEQETLAAQLFFEELALRLDASSDMKWGAAVSPDTSIDPFDGSEQETNRLTPDALPALRNTLIKTAGGPSYFAVCDLLLPATDENKQTALFAYVYAQAVSAHADLIFYSSLKSDAYGLYNNNGQARPICELYKTIDTSPSREIRTLCRTVSEKALDALDSISRTRRVINGIANHGMGSGKTKTLFDFETGNVNGFTAVGAPFTYMEQANPQIVQSAAYNAPTLYASLRDGKAETGIRRLMADGKDLQDVTSLSWQVLAQYPHSEATAATLTLRLQGVNDNGEALWMETSIQTNVRQWQSVSFNVSDFTETADLSHPVVMTLLVSPDVSAQTDAEKDFGLWVRSVTANRPAPDYSLFFIVLLTVGGVGVSFLAIFSAYVVSKRRKVGARRARK